MLNEARAGEPGAAARLRAVYLPIVRRWAVGQVPLPLRSRADALAQQVLARALVRLDERQPRHEADFLAGLRAELHHCIRGEMAQPSLSEAAANLAQSRSWLAEAVGSQTLADYERALAGLLEADRELVLLRFEFGYSLQEIADAAGLASVAAARLAVRRALVALAEQIDGH